LYLPFWGKIVSDQLDSLHPCWKNTQEIYRADYRRLRSLVDLGQLPLRTLRRMTWDMMRRLNVDDPALVLPPEHITDGFERGGTLIGDTFVEDIDTALTAHTPTGTGGFPGWTKLTGGAAAVTVIAATDLVQSDQDGGLVWCRADFDHSSDGHYSQLDFQHTADGGSGGPAVRVQNTDGTTITLYLAFDQRFGAGFVLNRYLSSTPTQLATASGSRNGIFYLEIDEADVYTVKDDGITIIGPTTDASPQTGQVRPGFALRDDDGEATIDTFTSDVLAIATATSRGMTLLGVGN